MSENLSLGQVKKPGLRSRYILLPSGERLRIEWRSIEERQEKLEALLEEWRDYCETNWLSDDHEDRQCGERKVKAFMDAVSSLMIHEE